MSIPEDEEGFDEAVAFGSSRGLGGMVLRGSMWLLLARVVRSILSLMGLAILARLLQPADFGVLVMALTFTFLGTVLLMGMLDAPLTRHLDMKQDDLRGLIWLGLVLMFVLSAILWVAAPWLEAGMRFPRLAQGIRAVTPVLLLQTFMIAGTAVLRRLHRFRAVAALSVLNIVFYLVPAIALAALGFGLWSVLAGQIIAALVTAIQFVRAARLPLAPPRRFPLGEIGQTGWYGVGTKLVEFAVTSVDTLAVALTMGPATTGIYSRAYNIGTQIKEPFTAVDSTIRQALAKLKDEAGYRREIDRIVRLIVIASSLIVAGVFAAREELVRILLGQKFAAAAPILAFILLALPARTLMLTIEGATVARGNMVNALARTILTLSIITPGVFIGARYGAEGVAVAVATASWVGALFALKLFARDMKRSYWSLVVLLLPGFGMGLIMAGFGTWIEQGAAGLSPLVRLALMIAVFGIASALIGIVLPESWLPRVGNEARRRILRIVGLRRPA